MAGFNFNPHILIFSFHLRSNHGFKLRLWLQFCEIVADVTTIAVGESKNIDVADIAVVDFLFFKSP